MKNFISIISFALFFFYSCVQNDKVTIRIVVDDIIKETQVDKDLTDLLFHISVFSHVQEVEGLEKLNELRELNLRLSGVYSDYSFLQNMKNMKKLILANCSIDNLDFLRSMKDLEVLYLESSRLYKNEIDLQNNKKLKYLNLSIIFDKNKYTPNSVLPFVPDIENIPDSLEYLDIGRSFYIIASMEFLTKLLKIPHVILDDARLEYHRKELLKNDEFAKVHKSYIDNWDFIQSHTNFILKDPKEVLPEEYQKETFFYNYMERDIEPKMKEVSNEKK